MWTQIITKKHYPNQLICLTDIFLSWFRERSLIWENIVDQKWLKIPLFNIMLLGVRWRRACSFLHPLRKLIYQQLIPLEGIFFHLPTTISSAQSFDSLFFSLLHVKLPLRYTPSSRPISNGSSPSTTPKLPVRL